MLNHNPSIVVMSGILHHNVGVRIGIDFRTVTLGVEGRVFCGDRWETR